ncbi:ribonuclease III domain-containing protein, partial [Haemophilus parainfluenzae]|uniref:ribonuclease III domain-containing protein n=1 Tax=Haemophilus parainfluenzae TaxID=729 RepID=UPI00157F5B7B
ENPGSGEDNERLEYLGDRILNSIISEMLYIQYPGYQEGKLTDMLSSRVNNIALANLGRKIALGDHLRLGRGVDLQGGRDNVRI